MREYLIDNKIDEEMRERIIDIINNDIELIQDDYSMKNILDDECIINNDIIYFNLFSEYDNEDDDDFDFKIELINDLLIIRYILN